MKVLVVEDDDDVRDIVVEALSNSGFEVLEADSGELALERCERDAAEVLFTDIRLRGTLDGWEVAERCREARPDIPVVYAIGVTSPGMRPVPGSRLLRKPYLPSQVVTAIHELVGPG
jgi:CheY-like chemotaxis protein